MILNHSAHDYTILVEKWQTLARRNSLSFKKVTIYNQFPVYELCNDCEGKAGSGLYLSAGIHGDEVAPCWSMLYWAEKNADLFKHIPIVIYPCLNPWGFINNCRADMNGEDLNRLWGNPMHPLLGKIILRLKNLTFRLSLNLHEDFDANGIYLYEPCQDAESGFWAEEILMTAQSLLPIDSRLTIDGRETINGIIRPDRNNPPLDGIPEAIYLIENHGRRNFTIETPSEASLCTRISAHEVMIEKAVHLALQY